MNSASKSVIYIKSMSVLNFILWQSYLEKLSFGDNFIKTTSSNFYTSNEVSLRNNVLRRENYYDTITGAGEKLYEWTL